MARWYRMLHGVGWEVAVGHTGDGGAPLVARHRATHLLMLYPKNSVTMSTLPFSVISVLAAVATAAPPLATAPVAAAAACDVGGWVGGWGLRWNEVNEGRYSRQRAAGRRGCRPGGFTCSLEHAAVSCSKCHAAHVHTRMTMLKHDYYAARPRDESTAGPRSSSSRWQRSSTSSSHVPGPVVVAPSRYQATARSHQPPARGQAATSHLSHPPATRQMPSSFQPATQQPQKPLATASDIQ